MKLLRFRANSLFSLGEIDINLEDRGLTLVTGYSKDEGSSNGAGKSSLASKGILWTLFGETAGGLRADAVTNRHKAKANCFGEVEFRGVDGAIYSVRRERPVALIFARGNITISSRTAKDTQEQINAALGLDFKTFIQTSFFGQGRVLSYASLTPKEQKAVLESILPMEEVDRWAQYADKNLKEITKAVTEAQRVVSAADVRLSTVLEESKKVKQLFEQWELQKQQKIAYAIADYERTELEFLKARETLAAEARQYSVLDFDAWETAIKEKLNLAEQQSIALAKEQRLAFESHAAWANERDKMRAIHASWKDKGICTECKRPLDDFDPETQKTKINETYALMEEATVNAGLALTASVHYGNELTLAEDRRKMALNDLNLCHESRRKFADHANAVEKLEMTISIEKMNRRAAIDRAEREENPYESQIGGHIAKIAILKQEATDANVALGKLNGEMEHLTYWRDVYAKELKLKLFEDACPYLDSRVNYYLGRLNNGQIHVRFSTVKRLANGNAKEEFNVYVYSDTGGEGFDSLSGGEQQMVSFSIGLGLADLSSRVNTGRSSLLILDEPFTELDLRNSDSIVSFLTSEQAYQGKTILLISNDEQLKSLIPNIIHVVKENGVTRVET